VEVANVIVGTEVVVGVAVGIGVTVATFFCGVMSLKVVRNIRTPIISLIVLFKKYT